MDFPRICPARWLSDPYDMFYPFCDMNTNYYRPWGWHNQSISKEFGSTIENEKGNYKISLDVQHFRPEDISVKVTDNEIIVEGKHEERPDTHGFITRQFKRRYALPNHCSSENVTSTMSSDGVLTIIAEKKPSQNMEKIIPIKMCGASSRKTQIASPTKGIIASTTSTSSEITLTAEKHKDTEISTSTNLDMTQNAQKNTQKTEKNKETDISTTSKLDMTEKAEKNKDNEILCRNKNNQIILREDHSRLLRPELLKETVAENIAEKGASKEVIDLMKTTEKIEAISSKLEESSNKIKESLEKSSLDMSELYSPSKLEESSNKIKESLEKSSLGMSELREQLGLASTSEMSTATGMSQMLMEQSSSSYKSSTITSSTNMSGKASECVSDIISAELREAAENV